jgi:acyl-CoA dehydrogenase
MKHSEITDLTARIIADHTVPRRERRAGGWSTPAWQALADAGLVRIGIDPASGGSGGTLAQACDVLWALGAAAVSLPVAETGVLAGWLLASAGLPLGDEPACLAVAPPGAVLARQHGRWRLRTKLARVPWAGCAGSIAVWCTDADGTERVVALRPADVAVSSGRNLAGEPRDDVVIDCPLDDWQVASAPAGVDRARLLRRGALARAAAMAGALERVAELTVSYTSTRTQFGKPVIAFQAVASMVVEIAERTAAASAAARAAIAAGDEAPFEVAVAKQQAGAAADEVTRLAHQAHGAIGMTAEYELGDLTKRLWCWRTEYGTEAYWARFIGEQVVAAGAGQLWPRITRRESRAGRASE